MTVGEMYLQGKEGTGGYSPDPALALRYLSMQQDPSVTGRALTELADILAGGACQTEKLMNLLERIEQKAVSFRQIYFLYRIYTEKRKELEDFTDVDEKQRKLVKQMEEKAEPEDDKKAVLQEKLAFYERTADRYGLNLWLEAAEQCMDAAKREEDKAEIQIKKARLLAEHNRKKEAEKAYETTISRYPKAAAGYIEYGFYLAREGKKDMAALMYRRARQLGAARDTEFQRLGAILGEGSK